MARVLIPLSILSLKDDCHLYYDADGIIIEEGISWLLVH